MRFPWERDDSERVYGLSKTVFPDNSIKIGYRHDNSIPYSVSLKNHNDIWELMLLNDILVRNNRKAFLQINYLMYQQDDRIFDIYESFGLKVLADILNGLKGFEKISVFDPHSDSVCLINNVNVLSASKQIESTINMIGTDDLCILTPDAGAYKKYMPQIPTNIPTYSCSKVRGKDGNIKTLVPNEITESKILIVDDIGLGCKTHTSISEKFMLDKDVYLYVSHGVFNQGVEHLKPYFKKVFTTDSITTEKETEFLKIIKL